MDLLSILLAIAGGIFGASIGALPAFIFTGVIGLIGWAIALAGGDSSFVNQVVFGPFFGPHIAFAGGVAAAAFAANKRKSLDSGTNTLLPLGSIGDPSIILVGGIFGAIGFLVNYLYSTVFGWSFDTIALTVATSGLIARFVFGSSGLIGKFQKSENESKRYFLPNGTAFIFTIIFSAAVALLAAYVADMTQSGIVFCISAASLLFAQMGFPIPTTHHITAVAGAATLLSGNILFGVLFGIISAIVFEVSARTVNSYVDTHVDPPAIAIAACTFIATLIFA